MGINIKEFTKGKNMKMSQHEVEMVVKKYVEQITMLESEHMDKNNLEVNMVSQTINDFSYHTYSTLDEFLKRNVNISVSFAKSKVDPKNYTTICRIDVVDEGKDSNFVFRKIYLESLHEFGVSKSVDIEHIKDILTEKTTKQAYILIKKITEEDDWFDVVKLDEEVD